MDKNECRDDMRVEAYNRRGNKLVNQLKNVASNTSLSQQLNKQLPLSSSILRHRKHLTFNLDAFNSYYENLHNEQRLHLLKKKETKVVQRKLQEPKWKTVIDIRLEELDNSFSQTRLENTQNRKIRHSMESMVAKGIQNKLHQTATPGTYSHNSKNNSVILSQQANTTHNSSATTTKILVSPLALSQPARTQISVKSEQRRQDRPVKRTFESTSSLTFIDDFTNLMATPLGRQQMAKKYPNLDLNQIGRDIPQARTVSNHGSMHGAASNSLRKSRSLAKKSKRESSTPKNLNKSLTHPTNINDISKVDSPLYRGYSKTQPTRPKFYASSITKTKSVVSVDHFSETDRSSDENLEKNLSVINLNLPTTDKMMRKSEMMRRKNREMELENLRCLSRQSQVSQVSRHSRHSRPSNFTSPMEVKLPSQASSMPRQYNEMSHRSKFSEKTDFSRNQPNLGHNFSNLSKPKSQISSDTFVSESLGGEIVNQSYSSCRLEAESFDDSASLSSGWVFFSGFILMAIESEICNFSSSPTKTCLLFIVRLASDDPERKVRRMRFKGLSCENMNLV